MRKWQHLNSAHTFNCSIFKIRCDEHYLPATGERHDFFIIEPANWVNIIALTDRAEVILIRQYRYGTGELTLEIPGGIIDEGESPEAAARRELLEETGYQASNWRLLGVNDPNPAIQNNRCYTFLAEQAHQIAAQQLDGTEEIEIEILPISTVPALIADQQIRHALVITAFYFYELAKR